MNILITGGASGLGSSITRRLASDNSNSVYITYANSHEASKSLEKEFSNVKSIKCDFNHIKSIIELTERMESINPDVLINNALTGMIKKHFTKLTGEDFLSSFKLNVLPVILITQSAIQEFKKKKSGKIITILTSYLINSPPTGLSEYVANKAYLLSLSKSWANELSKFNITSNCISPSFIKTNLNKDTDERVIEEMIFQNPLKKLLTPAEIADSVAFLTTSTRHINGINLIINAATDVI